MTHENGVAQRALPRQFFRFALHCGEIFDGFYMSQVLIQQYLNQLQDLRKASGTHREMVVREAFKDLLKGWGRSREPRSHTITGTVARYTRKFLIAALFISYRRSCDIYDGQ
jgi:hypothetical protein